VGRALGRGSVLGYKVVNTGSRGFRLRAKIGFPPAAPAAVARRSP